MWLFRSVRFRCMDELRRRNRQALPSDTIPDRIGVQGREHEGLDPRLENAMAGLNDRHRTLVTLKHVVGMSGDEIAAVMGTSRTAVYGALGRAERKLRSALVRAGFERGDR